VLTRLTLSHGLRLVSRRGARRRPRPRGSGKALRRAGQLRDAERLRGWLFRILKGRQLTLLPGTEVAPSALDEVVKRLRDGWVYVRA